MNNVNLIGRLTRDPELKEVGGQLVFREWTARDGVL
jgi:single-stranded DNA-binding protein